MLRNVALKVRYPISLRTRSTMKNVGWRELLRVGYTSDYLERVRTMERIIKVGQNEFRVDYRPACEKTPVIYGIHAVTDVILFDGAMPLLFNKDERIQLGEATKFTLDMEGKISLERMLADVISKSPKSSAGMEVVW